MCFHCHGTSSYHTTNTLQGRRAKIHVDTQTIQPGLGTSYSRPPINPYLTPPLLQNPGGDTAYCSTISVLLHTHMYCNLWFKYCMCHCYAIGQCFAMIKAIVFLNSDTVTHFATTKHFLNDKVFYILQNGSAEYNFKLIFFIHICRQKTYSAN